VIGKPGETQGDNMIKFRIGARVGATPDLRPQLLAAGLAVASLLLAACTSGPAVRSSVTTTSARQIAGGSGDCDSLTTCYTPHQIRVAYGIQPLLDRGIDGRGETVVLPELASSRLSAPQISDIRLDLARFDRLFGLPAVRLRVLTRLAGPASPWLADEEEVLDLEMVHVVAPAATLLVVLVKATALNNPRNAVAAAVAAIRLGLTRGGIISISAAGQTGGEHCDTPGEVARLHSALRDAADQHVTVVAASGDIGAVGEPCALIKALTGGTFTPVKEVNLPAADPLVLGVGGTSLTASHKSGAYIGETGWSLPFGNPGTAFQASGGGFSRRLSRPRYQDGVPGIGEFRAVPDVAGDASGHTGMALVISNDGQTYLRNSGGTSASAPFWAGLIALADQYAHRHLGFVNPAIYRIGRSALYRLAFHDITAGNNTVLFPPETIRGYRAARGWDPVTGWGSPRAQVLVPLLARYDSN
jgi:subtilase family serine protease